MDSDGSLCVHHYDIHRTISNALDGGGDLPEQKRETSTIFTDHLLKRSAASVGTARPA